MSNDLISNIIEKDINNSTVNEIINNGGIVSFVNPYSYWMLVRRGIDCELIDFWGIDGKSFQVLIKFLYGAHKKRISFDFTSIAEDVFALAESNCKSVCVIGSTDECVNEFCAVIKKAYPNIIIKYKRSGFFGSDSERALEIMKIEEMSPNIVVCGMGVINQEKFIIDLKKSGWRGAAFTCGGFIHQTAKGGKDYYPKIFNALNARFLYRIIDEPKLIKRYLIDYPAAFFMVIKNFILK